MLISSAIISSSASLNGPDLREIENSIVVSFKKEDSRLSVHFAILSG